MSESRLEEKKSHMRDFTAPSREQSGNNLHALTVPPTGSL